MNHKPDSVPFVLAKTFAKQTTEPSVWNGPCGSFPCSLPVLNGRAARPEFPPVHCLTLLPMRLAVPPALLPARWALTPPFHPYPTTHHPKTVEISTVFGWCVVGRFTFCCAVCFVWPGGQTNPGVTRHRTLRSPDFPPGPSPPKRLRTGRPPGSSLKKTCFRAYSSYSTPALSSSSSSSS